MFRPEVLLLPLTLLLSMLGGAVTSLEAQLREVVSSQIAVSQDDATLELELASDESVQVSLRDGAVVVDGETIGAYTRGDALDTSWRALLGDVVGLDNGPLARALVDWSPPEGLSGNGDLAQAAQQLDELLEARLTRAAPIPAPTPSQAPEPPSVEAPGDALRQLLSLGDRLAVVGLVLRGVDLNENLRVSVDEDVVVAEDEVLVGSQIVVDGNLDVLGTIRGDVGITGGRLRLEEGGTITGDVRLADAGLSRDGGTIEGSVTEISDARIRLLEEIADLDDLDDLDELEDLDELDRLVDMDELREDIRERVREEMAAEMDSDFWSRYGAPSPLRSVGRGLGGLVQNVIGFAVALLLAFGVTRLFPGNLTLVEKATERSPGRAALVGIAGLFLLVPAYVLGMVVLAVSIVGIPLLLLWIPLFPLAAVVAGGLGYLAVAVLLGRWIIRQDFRNLDFLQGGNDLHAAAAGLAALLIPYAIANVILMGGPWLGAIHGLLSAVGILAGSIALIVGFGGVLLTRGGRRPAFVGDLGGAGGSSAPPWGATPGSAADTETEWARDWDEEWKKEWDEEWEDLERGSRGRTEGGSEQPGGAEDRPDVPETGHGPEGESGSSTETDPREGDQAGSGDDRDEKDGGSRD
ncbi:MAG: polymer-forming cytoskeletal protein [Longimicrobiales bacterium]|nr:polymer-forming cytoskeletal protein [Longimicrobiales bacterium]